MIQPQFASGEQDKVRWTLGARTTPTPDLAQLVGSNPPTMQQNPTLPHVANSSANEKSLGTIVHDTSTNFSAEIAFQGPILPPQLNCFKENPNSLNLSMNLLPESGNPGRFSLILARICKSALLRNNQQSSLKNF